MTIAFNGIIILIIALIAYWWANQGLFSAMLHLLCVIAAGAVALALYEVITVRLLLRGTWFDDYAWGVTLVGLFVLFLAIFRITADKVVHANVNVPLWASYAFGAPIGAAAGILTMGIYMIGAGMIQSHQEVMGYAGYGRTQRTGQVEYLGPTLFVPVHRWTGGFYEYLSVGSLHPTFTDSALAKENPEIYKQASLLRDSLEQGKGKLSMAPEAVNIRGLTIDPESNRCAVEVEFSAIARDWGEQLTLSRSQVRLIATASGSDRAVAVHPDAWQQQTRDSGGQRRRFLFNTISSYITSIPGQERALAVIEFRLPDARHQPKYIQIRGTRFALPPAKEGLVLPGDEIFEIERVVLGTASAIDEHVQVTNDIRPIVASTNQPLGTLKIHEDGNLIVSGQHTFAGSRGDRPPMSLMIRGILEPPGTRVVQLTIEWDHLHNIFHTEIRRRVPDSARIRLVDHNGEAYSPIGYILESRSGNSIQIEPSRYMPTLAEFPVLAQGSGDRLRIIFRVTEGVTIRGFMLGDITMGLCEVEVSGRRN